MEVPFVVYCYKPTCNASEILREHLTEIGFKNVDHANEIFLKTNSEQVNDINRSKNKNKMHATPVRHPFEKKNEKFENLSYGSKTVQDFAKKLSERLKFLKPIK